MERLTFPLNLQLFGEDDDESKKGNSSEDDVDNDEVDDEDIGDGDLDGGNQGDDDGQHKDDKTKKHETDKEKNARQAEMRRQREQKEREEREKAIRDKAYLEGQLSSTKTNTFTNKPIKDEYDLKIFNLQKEIEANGGDPVTDLPEKLAELDRKEGAKRKEENEQEVKKKEKIDNDIADFKKAYPDVKVSDVLKDPMFAKYSNGKLGNSSLAEIYAEFLEFKDALGVKDDKSKQGKEEGSKQTPPSPNGGRKQEHTSYSNMTQEQRIKYLKEQGLIR